MGDSPTPRTPPTTAGSICSAGGAPSVLALGPVAVMGAGALVAATLPVYGLALTVARRRKRR